MSFQMCTPQRPLATQNVLDRSPYLHLASPQLPATLDNKLATPWTLMGRQQDNDVCHVCGDRASGRHYGVTSCEGCKSFFKRSLRVDVHYSCRYNQMCPINVVSRSRCQYCRLQKCFLVGMRKEGIRRKNVRADPTATLSSGVQSPRFFPSSYLVSPVNSSPKANHPPPLSYVRPIDFMSYRKGETICTNILRYLISWANDLPAFLDFPQSDKEAIVGSKWLDLLILVTSQYHLLPEMTRFLRSSSFNDDKTTVKMLRHVESQVEKWCLLNCDHVEMECLKAIVIYNPDCPGLANYTTLERLQRDTMGSLEVYIRSQNVLHAARFGRLLLHVGELRCLEEAIKADFLFPQLMHDKEFVTNFIKEEFSCKRLSNYNSYFCK